MTEKHVLSAAPVSPRAASRARDIWYFELTKQWWMETGTPREVAELLHPRIDGIRVTNAYEILDPAFIKALRDGQLRPTHAAHEVTSR